MSLVLHLSDLHLGMHGDSELLGDYKVAAISSDARVRRTTLIQSTLRELGKALTASGRALDALVVSGDVTYRGESAGFDLLEPTLGELGAALPPPERTLVVPGNHDVTWYTPPSSGERYRAFVDSVRRLGYVTPYLEGIDILPDGSLRAGAPSPVVTAHDGSFVIVALNSTNHCGVQLPTDDGLHAHLTDLHARSDKDPAILALLGSWRERGRFDVARVDPAQRRFASEALREGVAQSPRDTPPLQIAVMHHQLLPISLDEEVKPFESLTNLAEVRDWIAANGVHLLMHGHKHVGRLYEDRFLPEHHDRRAAVHRVLVSATATIGLGQGRSGEVAKLFDLDTELPTLGRLRATSVPAVDSGIPLDLSLLTVEERLAGVVSAPLAGIVEGSTVREVHEQLLALFATGAATPAAPLVCRVSEGSSARTIPSSYPQFEDGQNLQDWFKDMVNLWQSRTKLSSMPFNHGERFTDGADVDYVTRIVETLNAAPDTSRAIIMLLDRERDRIDDRAVEFPAFCLVQFTVVAARLNVHGYFRKQEMRYWWPVNAGELARLQEQVRMELAKLGRSFDAGEIVTVTAIPTVGRAVPRVAVPRIDRFVDEEPDRLLRMALLPYHPHLPQRTSILADWRLLVEECRPTDRQAADGNPVPIAGLRVLRTHLQAVGGAHGSVAQVDGLCDVLDLLIANNEAYLNAARHVPGTIPHADRPHGTLLAERLSDAVDTMAREEPAAEVPTLHG